MRGIEQIPWLYEIICSLYERAGLAEWRQALVAGSRGRVLDIGSGTGRNLPLLLDGTAVVGLDPSLDALRRARRRAPRALLVVARAEALPFQDGVFDTDEHVRSSVPWRARLQDLIQPAWTRAAGGCRPNRDTEAAVERAGFRIEADGRRARGNNRLFSARAGGSSR